MRIRSFQLMPRRAAARWLGLLALVLSAIVPGPARAEVPMGASELQALESARAAAINSGEFPAFAGRVDPDTYRVGPGDE
ncbi:MAG TPA: hypothetical protein VI198_08060, partial [Candidatus Eisenbacteria bacterium]